MTLLSVRTTIIVLLFLLLPGKGLGLTVRLGEGLYLIPTLRKSLPLFPPGVAEVHRTIYRYSSVSNPTDIIYFKGKYVATELVKNRLAIFDDFTFKSLRFFDPLSIGKRFTNPHFLAISKSNTLLITNGWGNSIVEMRTVNGEGWKEFHGIDAFNAPHGICVDEEGWIYVGDSLNSRLVRFRDLNGRDWQVFADKENKIAYIRQLVCTDGEIWAANSYEARPGLNSGTGANILRISNFESGHASVVLSRPRTNVTGAYPMVGGVLWAEWSGGNRLMSARQGASQMVVEQQYLPSLGTPYGIFYDSRSMRCIISYIGDLHRPNAARGGFLAITLQE